ncbi:MAG: hypothetical protein Kow00109_29960 [Acidobacteriota bacterium]
MKPGRERRSRTWSRLAAGLALFLVAVPFLAPYQPERQFRRYANCPPTFWPASVEAAGRCSSAVSPDWLVTGDPYRILGWTLRVHLFGSPDADKPLFVLGSDALGRDLLSRFLYGLRVSLLLALGSGLATLLVGTLVGGLAAYTGGLLDTVVMRICDLFLALPGLFLVLGVRALFPLELHGSRSLLVMGMVFVLLGWAAVARVVAGQVREVKQRPHVLAARVLGVPGLSILLRHILPFLAGPLVVQFGFFLPAFIVAELTLSYLGVGIQEPDPSLGGLLRESLNVAALTIRKWKLIPAAGMFGLILVLNYLGDRLKAGGRGRAQVW